MVNEYFAVHLAREIGLTVPDWSAVQVNAQVLEALPDARFSYLGGHPIYTPGIHFGNRFVTATALPSEWNALWPRSGDNRILNSSEIAGALAFDTWVDNTDRRQAVFVPAQRRSQTLKAFWSTTAVALVIRRGTLSFLERNPSSLTTACMQQRVSGTTLNLGWAG